MEETTKPSFARSIRWQIYLRHANTKTANTAKTAINARNRQQTRKHNKQKLAYLLPHIAMREKFDDKGLGLQRLTARSLLASLDEVEKHRDHKPISYSQIKSAFRGTEITSR
jgi:hypothetical protein